MTMSTNARGRMTAIAKVPPSTDLCCTTGEGSGEVCLTVVDCSTDVAFVVAFVVTDGCVFDVVSVAAFV